MASWTKNRAPFPLGGAASSFKNGGLSLSILVRLVGQGVFQSILEPQIASGIPRALLSHFNHKIHLCLI